MRVKLLYEKPEGQGELSIGIAIHTLLEKNFPNIKVEVDYDDSLNEITENDNFEKAKHAIERIKRRY